VREPAEKAPRSRVELPPLTPEIRIDPLTGLKVALAPGRAKRPQAWLPVSDEHSVPSGPVPGCPFCGGHEDQTPPETYALRPDGGPPDSGGWVVRAVPNKFPVFVAADGHDPSDPLERGRGDPELLSSTVASGTHEVIVHSPDHITSMGVLPADQFGLALQGWRDRLSAHADAAWVHLMVNEGISAGASLEHTHAQLYALPFVPVLAARERERFRAHNIRTMGSCLLCDLLQEEVRLRERIVAVDEQAVLLAPYASRTPYELQLVPRSHATSLIDVDPSAAGLLQEGLLRLKRVLGASPPLNMWLRTAPRDAEHYHWRIDVVPRLTQLAGLELGAGVAVNVYPPELAAADLRN
jgi:UDPglucose--hexose-1-phosphate uridylyltransferase